MYDILVIGAGPAGLTAAIYARRASKSVLVLEALTYGGQIVNTLEIENYPAEPHISGFDFATKLYNQAKELGAEVRFERVTEIRKGSSDADASHFGVITAKSEYEAKTVIIATGSANRKLGISGEEALIGRGISYCATCDGAFYRGKTVAVVGGGNTALEDALYLSDVAGKVYLIHRRDEFRGEEIAAAGLKKKANVEFILNSVVTELKEDGGKLVSVTVADAKSIAAGEPTGLREIPVDGLFVAVGRIPSNQSFAGLIETDEAGYIKAGENCKTNVPGIFVAGDNRTKEVRQLVTAASDGAIAATAAINFLNR